MSDIFDELAASFGSSDPTELARSAVKPALPKRFYTAVTIDEASADGRHRILLDGRPVRTPARNFLAVARRRAAEALAAEWAGQGEKIDPATMPLTRLVNSAIDGVAREVDAVKAEIAGYADSDMLCYRADGPDRFVARQRAQWDPPLAWAEQRLGVRFTLTEGVMHVAQPPAALAAVIAALPDDAERLAALHAVTALTGSVLLALALNEGAATPEAVWTAAHLDEDWNAELWGMDAEAAARRAFRRTEFDAALVLLGLR